LVLFLSFSFSLKISRHVLVGGITKIADGNSTRPTLDVVRRYKAWDNAIAFISLFLENAMHIADLHAKALAKHAFRAKQKVPHVPCHGKSCLALHTTDIQTRG
jgi:hypothetical protein